MNFYGSIAQDGLSAPEILALYDAVLFGMLDYIDRHKECASLVEDVDPWDTVALYYVLARAGVFDDPLCLNRLSLDVERALWQGPRSFDPEALISEAEKMLRQLGIVSLEQSLSKHESKATH